MLSYIFKIFGKNKKSPEMIEVEMEMTRSEYLKEINKVRTKYAAALLTLSNEYKKACSQA